MIRRNRVVTASVAAVYMATLPLAMGPALAAGKKAHKNILERHPVATGVAAGLAAHHMAKRRAAAGKKPNLAERHPVATGLVAGLAAHHMAKKKK